MRCITQQKTLFAVKCFSLAAGDHKRITNPVFRGRYVLQSLRVAFKKSPITNSTEWMAVFAILGTKITEHTILPIRDGLFSVLKVSIEHPEMADPGFRTKLAFEMTIGPDGSVTSHNILGQSTWNVI